MIKVELRRIKGDFGFEVTDANNQVLHTDSSVENGGQAAGFRPMQLLLAALGSCSAIDMVSILKKQRQEITGFEIEVTGEREDNVVPALWKYCKVIFRLQGVIDRDKAEKAAALSMEKYCSVAETLRRAGAVIEWEVQLTTA